jgi:hypothetical protein
MIVSRWEPWGPWQGVETVDHDVTPRIETDAIALLGVPVRLWPSIESYRRIYVFSRAGLRFFTPHLDSCYQVTQRYFLDTWRFKMAGGMMRVGGFFNGPSSWTVQSMTFAAILFPLVLHWRGMSSPFMVPATDRSDLKRGAHESGDFEERIDRGTGWNSSGG